MTAEELAYLLETLDAMHAADRALVRALDRERGWARMHVRVAGLAAEDAVQVVIVDPLWTDATDLDVAELTGVCVDQARAHRIAFERSTRIREVIARAREAAVRMGFPGLPSELLLAALEAFERSGSTTIHAPRRAA